MAESDFQNLDILDSLFPFEPRRELAFKYVEALSNLQYVQRIFSMEVGQRNSKHSQRIFIVCDGDEFGIPTVEEMEGVMECFRKICPDLASQEILGYAPVLTNSLFEEDRESLSIIKYKKATVLWERIEKFKSDGSLNPNLN